MLAPPRESVPSTGEQVEALKQIADAVDQTRGAICENAVVAASKTESISR